MTSQRTAVKVTAAASLVIALGTFGPAHGQSPVTAGAGTPIRSAPAATDGRLVFNDYGTGQLYTSNPDGSALVQITHLQDGQFARHAIWSPDSTQVLFAGILHGNAWIYQIRADGTGRHLVFKDQPGYDDNQPAYAVDGEHVLFSRCQEAGCAVYSVGIDGSDLTALTHYRHGIRGGYDTGPVASPDGQWIAFTRYGFNGIRAQIWLMNTSGGDAHPITRISLSAEFPTWSSDGALIYFQGPSGGLGDDVYSMKPAGSHLTKMTFTAYPHGSFNGSNSPSGAEIAFISDRTHTDLCCQDLFTMNSDGTNQLFITTGLTLPGAPDWGSAPLQAGPSVQPPALTQEQIRAGKARELLDQPWLQLHHDGR